MRGLAAGALTVTPRVACPQAAYLEWIKKKEKLDAEREAARRRATGGTAGLPGKSNGDTAELVSTPVVTPLGLTVSRAGSVGLTHVFGK